MNGWSNSACRITGLLLLGLALSSLWFPCGSQDEKPQIQFIGVTLGDQDYDKADQNLSNYLAGSLREQFKARLTPIDYHAAIANLVDHDPNAPYVARLTPYVFVVAEILGADFEALATYQSKSTNALTYHAYFVVNIRNPSYQFPDQPTLRDVGEFLRKEPRRFVYHDKFSTSSYFLPLKYFQGHKIYKTSPGQESASLYKIIVESPLEGEGSSALVKRVASGAADIAAVWDGTKKKYENDKEYSSIRFIQIRGTLPNDILVCSKTLDEDRKRSIRKAIASMGQTRPVLSDEFLYWVELQSAPDAREALAELRQMAFAQPAKITVEVKIGNQTGSSLNALCKPYFRAAEQAVKLSSGEFVLYDRDYYHGSSDIELSIERIHDGAIKLTSHINGEYKIHGKNLVKDQEFFISFNDLDDLTKRIESIIHSRLHRIRYVWPFEDITPTVLRDVPFTLPQGKPLAVTPIVWNDPERGAYSPGETFAASIVKSNPSVFELDPKDFQTAPQGLAIDPMSNVAYRVVLTRPSDEKPLFHYLTVGLVLLFVLGALFAAWDLVRKTGKQRDTLA